jgi:hypothetical protein
LTVTGPGVRIPLSPQKETHNNVVGFLFSKKSQIHLRFFLENKKAKFLQRIWVSMLVQDSFLGRTK